MDEPDTSLAAQAREVAIAQWDARARSHDIDRSGWTRAQYVEDAERLMDEVDGAVTSLVNGHIFALLEEIRVLRGEPQKPLYTAFELPEPEDPEYCGMYCQHNAPGECPCGPCTWIRTNTGFRHANGCAYA